MFTGVVVGPVPATDSTPAIDVTTTNINVEITAVTEIEITTFPTITEQAEHVTTTNNEITAVTEIEITTFPTNTKQAEHVTTTNAEITTVATTVITEDVSNTDDVLEVVNAKTTLPAESTTLTTDVVMDIGHQESFKLITVIIAAAALTVASVAVMIVVVLVLTLIYKKCSKKDACVQGNETTLELRNVRGGGVDERAGYDLRENLAYLFMKSADYTELRRNEAYSVMNPLAKEK